MILVKRERKGCNSSIQKSMIRREDEDLLDREHNKEHINNFRRDKENRKKLHMHIKTP